MKKILLINFVVFISILFVSMLFSQEGSSHSLLKIGTSKNLNGVEYKLIEAKKVESNIHLKIEVKNIDRKNFNYSALLCVNTIGGLF